MSARAGDLLAETFHQFPESAIALGCAGVSGNEIDGLFGGKRLRAPDRGWAGGGMMRDSCAIAERRENSGCQIEAGEKVDSDIAPAHVIVHQDIPEEALVLINERRDEGGS